MDSPADFRILVVDDDPSARRAHARLVERLGYQVETAEDGIAALARLPLEVDLIVLDAQMPHLDGFEVAERIRRHDQVLPIVMVTGLVDPEHRRRALSIGINDFVTKPVDHLELELRIRWLLRMKRAFDQVEEQRARLEVTVESRTKELRRALEEVVSSERRTHAAHIDTVHRLTIAAEYKDADTAGHIERIGAYAALVARALHWPPSAIELIRHAAPMHDIGKLGIPDRVLLKPGPLDGDEWEIMRTHTTIGEGILAGSESPLIQLGTKIAASHHEKWDGSGYPRGLGGEEIPMAARICAVLDFFDALTMKRPYREAVPADDVIGMMEEQRGSHFDPQVLDCFLRLRPQVESVRASYPTAKG